MPLGQQAAKLNDRRGVFRCLDKVFDNAAGLIAGYRRRHFSEMPTNCKVTRFGLLYRETKLTHSGRGTLSGPI